MVWVREKREDEWSLEMRYVKLKSVCTDRRLEEVVSRKTAFYIRS